jgi:FkbM family methyltransferase
MYVIQQWPTQMIDTWMVPAYDDHFHTQFDQRGAYQIKQRKQAINACGPRRHVVDVGANIGLWARDFCRWFHNVTLFEPDPHNCHCLEHNLRHKSNWHLYPVALGSQPGTVTLYGAVDQCGNRSVHSSAGPVAQTVSVQTMDSYNLSNVDLIKLDTQGSELDILKGAVQTILNCQPVLCVEMSANSEEDLDRHRDIQHLLGQLDYVPTGGIKKDKIYTHRGQLSEDRRRRLDMLSR